MAARAWGTQIAKGTAPRPWKGRPTERTSNCRAAIASHCGQERLALLKQRATRDDSECLPCVLEVFPR
eukprot:4102328-Lingulodinium_polyedra.AAC.1